MYLSRTFPLVIFCLPFARWRSVWDTHKYPLYDILISLVFFFFPFPFSLRWLTSDFCPQQASHHAHHRSVDDDRLMNPDYGPY